jgi:putative addiction module killer protein
MIELRRYVDGRGKDVFGEWFSRLKDPRAKAKIAIRLDRLALRKVWRLQALREGLCELRIDWGPGYRVYYTMLGKACVLLLGGGDKKQQSADIERATACMKDYKERTERQ